MQFLLERITLKERICTTKLIYVANKEKKYKIHERKINKQIENVSYFVGLEVGNFKIELILQN